MKSSVAVTLIICGTTLILAPYVESSIGISQVAHLIATTQKTVNMTGSLPQSYAAWTMVIGAIVIFIGIFGAMKGKD